MGVEVLAIDGAPAAADLESRLDAFASVRADPGRLLASRPRRRYATARVRSGRLARGVAQTGEAPLRGHAPHRRSRRRRRKRSSSPPPALAARHGYEAGGRRGADGRCGNRFHEGVPSGARRRAGEGGRLLDEREPCRCGRRCSWTKRSLIRARSRLAIAKVGGGRSRSTMSGSTPSRRASSSLRTPSSPSPARPAASSRLSPPIWPGRREGRSTCSTWYRSPIPADPDIAAFTTDKEALKRTIFDRMKDAGERATPAVVEKEMARIERAHAALSAIGAIRSAGGQAYYHSVDLRDGEAVVDGSRAHLRNEWTDRCAAPRRRAGGQSSHRGQDARGVRPRLRRQGRRLVQSPPGHRRPPSARCCRVQLGRGPLRQRRPDRLQRRERSAVQGDRLAQRHAAEHPGHRHRLDGVGRHRHGVARLHSDRDEGGRHRHAAGACRHPDRAS